MALYVTRTLDDGAVVIADLSDNKDYAVVTAAAWNTIKALPADQRKAAIDAAVAAAAVEWKAERGPDSEMGRNQEAGTGGPTSHGE